MSRYAIIDNEIVSNIVEAENVEFLQAFFPDSLIIQETKETKTAFIGQRFIYDKKIFIPIKIYESWILDNESLEWKPPKPKPSDGELYVWDEDKKDWVTMESIEIKNAQFLNLISVEEEDA